jgi:hypothetical protein
MQWACPQFGLWPHHGTCWAVPHSWQMNTRSLTLASDWPSGRPDLLPGGSIFPLTWGTGLPAGACRTRLETPLEAPRGAREVIGPLGHGHGCRQIPGSRDRWHPPSTPLGTSSRHVPARGRVWHLGPSRGLPRAGARQARRGQSLERLGRRAGTARGARWRVPSSCLLPADSPVGARLPSGSALCS